MSMYIFVHAHICTVHSLVCSLILWLFLAPLPPQHFFSFLFFIWYLFFFARGGQRWARTCSECERVGLSVCRWLNAYVYMRVCPHMYSALTRLLSNPLESFSPLYSHSIFFSFLFFIIYIYIFFCAGGAEVGEDMQWVWAGRTECVQVIVCVCIYVCMPMYVQCTRLLSNPLTLSRPSTPTVFFFSLLFSYDIYFFLRGGTEVGEDMQWVWAGRIECV